MAATLLPTLSPPVSRAAALLLLRRAPPLPFSLPAPLLRRLLSSTPSPPVRSPAFRFLATMPSAAAAAGGSRAMPDRADLLMLGIETSCDDTAAAVVRGDGVILSQVVSSQVVQKALNDANVSESDLCAVAVTVGPGLSLCLRVGVHKARKIAKEFRLPIVGGHNLLVLAHELGKYVQLGTTIDDAIGEAYDKSARWLGLDIRKGGGPALEQLALEGDPKAIKFSVPMRQHKDCNFSYAGLKTQVRLAIESRNIPADHISISSATEEDRQLRANIAASFQRVAVLHLEERCQRAVEWALKMEPSIKYFVVSGGVASNQYVRTHLNHIADKNGLQLVCPPPSLCTDNGVMIAWTGIEHFIAGRFDDPPAFDEPDDMQVMQQINMVS
uniref:N(6)-L-threonylcarbamoyladenine synthase n=1 Tax=Leersia perrieri TaxID=77586 RepID=A0A0D9UZZ3_9ORYZ